MKIEEFINELEKININLNQKQLEQLERYYELLIEWNEKINLTGIVEKKDVYLKHFYDSLTISRVINLNEVETLCDVGTGAGFPGLVLKIVYPNLKITLIDSLNKRINFLNEVIKQLELKNIETIHSRIEEYGTKNREKYDIVVARAVASLNILSEYCIPLVKQKGYFIAMKGNVEEELEKSKKAIKILGCDHIIKDEFYLPFENSLRTIIKIEKINKTDKKYPRRYNEIKNKPL